MFLCHEYMLVHWHFLGYSDTVIYYIICITNLKIKYKESTYVGNCVIYIINIRCSFPCINLVQYLSSITTYMFKAIYLFLYINLNS